VTISAPVRPRWLPGGFPGEIASRWPNAALRPPVYGFSQGGTARGGSHGAMLFLHESFSCRGAARKPAIRTLRSETLQPNARFADTSAVRDQGQDNGILRFAEVGQQSAGFGVRTKSPSAPGAECRSGAPTGCVTVYRAVGDIIISTIPEVSASKLRRRAGYSWNDSMKVRTTDSAGWIAQLRFSCHSS